MRLPEVAPPIAESWVPRAAWLVLLACVAVTASLAVACRGSIEADEVLHWLYARHAGDRPWNLLHVWARPLATLWIWPFSFGGLRGAHAASVIAGGVTAWTVWRAGRALGWRHAACAIPFVFVQPFFMQQTYGVWTEIVFAAVMGGWVWAVAASRPRMAALIAAVLPLARPEGFGIAALTALLAVCGALDAAGPTAGKPVWRDRLVVAAITPLGVVAWALLAAIASGDPLWLIHNWPPDWNPNRGYGSGPVGWLVDVVPQVVPAVLLPLVAIGIVAPRMRRAWAVTAAAAVILGVHGTLWVLGSFGSAGYARYFVTLAPVFALLMAGGVERLGARRVSGMVTLVVAVAIAGVLLARSDFALRVATDPPDARVFRALGRWIEAREPDAVVWAAHPYVYLELSRVPPSRFENFGDFRPAVVRAIPVGNLLLVEDRLYLRQALTPGHEAEADRLNVPEESLPAFGFERVDVPELGVDQTVTDPRHDTALEYFHWALWRKVRV